jgi:hypothetical protein
VSERVSYERRTASDGGITYGQSDASSTAKTSLVSLPETLDSVSDWAHRTLEASRPPPRPVQPMTDQTLGSPLQQLDEAVTRFISGPILEREEETFPLVPDGSQQGSLSDIMVAECGKHTENLA